MTARRRSSRRKTADPASNPAEAPEKSLTADEPSETTAELPQPDAPSTPAPAEKPSEDAPKPSGGRRRSRRGGRSKSSSSAAPKSDAAAQPAPSAAKEEPKDSAPPPPSGAREMIINAAQEQECRIAVLENGRLEELYTERAGAAGHVGNIYKGRITNVEPSIQAAFIDFGIGQNGFLHISDLNSSYFPDENGDKERVGRKTPRRDRPPIQECLRRGQEIIVQVIKEGIGTKGPTLTTYLSIPGRFLVLMPGMNRLGISRKIEDEVARAKAREAVQQLKPPKDIGIIIRTAGVDRTKREIQRDMTYLLRLWATVQEKIAKGPTPTLLYQESDLVIRTIRDVFNSNIARILCDNPTTIKKVRDFLSIAMPRTRCRISVYEGETPIFTKYRIEEEIERVQSRHVPLRSGGSIVIDQTEAIVAIDVNSGTYRAHDDAESTAFRINMEAAPEIARQLRLRDLGGVIIMDFIDMLQEKHRRSVEKALRDAVANDRARTKILRTSQFGIIEMTRQRMRPSLKRANFMDCPHCRGLGLMKTPESMAIEVMRQIQSCAANDRVASIEAAVAPDVAGFLLNRFRAELAQLERDHEKHISILADRNLSNDQVTFSNRDSRGAIMSA